MNPILKNLPNTIDEKADLLVLANQLRDALQDLFDDWKTLVGDDLKENNADVRRLWEKAEAALAEATGGTN